MNLMNLTNSINLMNLTNSMNLTNLTGKMTYINTMWIHFLFAFKLMDRLPKPTPAWALSFPQPRSHPPNISTDGLHELVATQAPAVDFIIVDVRRTDVDASTIRNP